MAIWWRRIAHGFADECCYPSVQHVLLSWAWDTERLVAGDGLLLVELFYG